MGKEFQRKALLPVGVSEIEEVAALGGASVVHEHVEMAEFPLHRLDQFCRRVLLA